MDAVLTIFRQIVEGLRAAHAERIVLPTGRLPFGESYDGDSERERERRFVPPVPVSELNTRVPPAVGAIIAKCPAPEIADRYQTATQLRDDLARRPLRYAPKLSRRELATKWATRNRLLLAALVVLGVAGASAAAFVRHDSRREARINRLELLAAGEPFAGDAEDAEFLFGMADRDSAYRERAAAAAHRPLDRFGAWGDRDWFRRGAFQALDPERAAGFRRQAAGLMLGLAGRGRRWSRPAARHTDPVAQSHALHRLRIVDAVNASRDGVLVAAREPDGVGLRIVYANPAFEELTGYGTEEAVGQSPSVLYSESAPDEREAAHESLRVGAGPCFQIVLPAVPGPRGGRSQTRRSRGGSRTGRTGPWSSSKTNPPSALASAILTGGGYSVAAIARALSPAVGIVFMPGHVEPEPVVPGAVYLQKPFTPAALHRAIHHVCALAEMPSSRV